VGLSVDLVTLRQTLAKDEGIRKCAETGADMDWSAPGEVEGREIEEPAVSLRDVSE
jgi:hypothetical protein